jgi:hypothetical protein
MDSCLGCPPRDRTLPAYYRFQYDRQKLARFSLLHLVSLRPQERPVDLKQYVIDGSRTSSISPWALIHWDAKQLAMTCRSSVFPVQQWGDQLRQPLAALAPAPERKTVAKTSVHTHGLSSFWGAQLAKDVSRDRGKSGCGESGAPTRAGHKESWRRASRLQDSNLGRSRSVCGKGPGRSVLRVRVWRGKSSDLGRAEETRRERRVASVLELDVQAAVHIVLMVCFGRFHAVYVDCRRTSNRPNCGEERAPCNASDLTKDRRNVLGREVIENTI